MPIWATAGSGCDMETNLKEDWRPEGDPPQSVFWGVPHPGSQEALQSVDHAAEALAAP